MDLPSYISIAGWFVQVIFDKYLSSKLRAWAAASGFGCDLDNLRLSILRIQSVLLSAQKLHATGILMWLRELKDITYDAEDLLDELEYHRLQQELYHRSAADHFQTISPFSDIVGSIYSKFSSMDAAACETSTPELIKWDRATRLRIRNIAERLNTTASNVSEALSLTKLANEASHGAFRQRTTSILHARVFGREAEAEAIAGQLLKQGRGDGVVSSILPIVGVAGIGKTTVAQLVYNHPTIINAFDLRMWVSVSRGIDEVRITREIIESGSVDGDAKKCCCLTNFNILQVMLQEKIMSKRFLLVLDDVWCDETAVERERWERLLAPLRVGHSCSWILVTTRMVGTAQMLGSMERAIFLQGLRDHDFWSLMKASASQDIDENDEDMKSYRFGKRIAKRFNGLPFAAKAAAVLLRDDYEAVEEWNHNRESNRIWENIMPIMELDYRQLSGHLQHCFAYCGLFPSEWKFRNDELLHLWMAQGYISPHDVNRATRMEDTGKEYLNNLVLKSFLEMHKEEFITYYQMNNLMHLLAQSVSLDECYRIEDDEQANIPTTVRHVSICTDAVSCLNSQVVALANLRSLIFFKGIQDDAGISFLQDVLKELKSIRALDISHCKIQMLPDEVGRCCIYLRYLNLSFTSIQTLPESLCRLYHLQVLNLQGCRLHSLPSGMSNLVNLRHLIAPNQLIAKIRSIGSLTCLQQLQMFRVRKEEGYQIDQLKGLKEIRGLLQIRNLENLESKSEASKATLHNKKHIEMLQLMWDFSHVISAIHPAEEEVLEALRPHPSLKRLDIMGYKGTRSPSWMKNIFLSNVVILYLCNCPKWECFPPLGQLPSLRVLWLKGMHSIKIVGPELYGNTNNVFQCLQELVLDDMQELEDWWRDGIMLSSLCNVIIKDCTKLKGLPLYPQKITELTLARKGHWLPYYDEYRRVQISKVTSSLCIYNCPLIIAGFSALENDLAMAISSLKGLTIDDVSLLATPLLERSLSCLKCLDIQDCPGMVRFNAREEQVFLLLSSLQRLYISGCTELRSLPMELRNLTSLENLVVINCPAIQSLPEKGLPLALRALEITSCHPLIKERCKKENGDDWHRISYIPRIEIDGEIIPVQ